MCQAWMNSMQVYNTVPDIQSKVQYSLLSNFIVTKLHTNHIYSWSTPAWMIKQNLCSFNISRWGKEKRYMLTGRGREVDRQTDRQTDRQRKREREREREMYLQYFCHHSDESLYCRSQSNTYHRSSSWSQSHCMVHQGSPGLDHWSWNLQIRSHMLPPPSCGWLQGRHISWQIAGNLR